jgi:hypothetical protein
MIFRSLLKNGYSNFSLNILEYCSPEKAIEREQYYLDFLKPEYNILKKAGSSLGRKHSDEAKEKMKLKALTPERLEQFKRLLASQKGQARPEGAGRPSIFIEVIDTLTDQITVYPSTGEAARAIGVGMSSIGMAFKRQEEKGVSTI